MTQPVSILIPLYDGARHLRECLDSVVGQTYPLSEILVVDDGSTDEGPDIVREYRARDARIVYVQNEKNLGLVQNWNRCVELAASPWLKFVFQDDVLEPTCVERLMEFAEEPATLVACRRDFIFDDAVTAETKDRYGRHVALIDSIFATSDVVSAETCRQLALDRFGFNLYGEPTSVLLHKSFFTRFGPFRAGLIMSCDLEYWTRVAIHCGARFVPTTLAHFRVHGAAVSANNLKSRAFRTATLDKLLILRDYVKQAAYEPMRRHAAERTPPVDLRKRLRNAIHAAFAAAEWARPGDAQPMQELQQFYREFPDLKPTRLAHFFWRLQLKLNPANAGTLLESMS